MMSLAKNYDEMSLFTRLEPFSEMCFCPSDENYDVTKMTSLARQFVVRNINLKANYDEIMTRVKGTDLQFVGDRIQRLAIEFKGWRSAIFLSLGDFLVSRRFSSQALCGHWVLLRTS
jgi:hypothetical protein